MSNNFISNSCVNNLYIFYQLIEKRKINFNDFDIPKTKFIRYIGNIRFMLIEYQLYHLDIVYNYSTNCYELIGDI